MRIVCPSLSLRSLERQGGDSGFDGGPHLLLSSRRSITHSPAAFFTSSN
jgi:hypothetical protein